MKTKSRLLRLFLWASLVATGSRALAQTWAQTSAPTTNWSSVASSADGSKLLAAVNGGGIYTSPDSGATLTDGPITNWQAVASTADGTKLVAAAYSSYPWNLRNEVILSSLRENRFYRLKH